jgi:signal transduction histidine kinase
MALRGRALLAEENPMHRVYEKSKIFEVPSRIHPGPEQTERLSSMGARAAILSHELANSIAVISSALQFIDTELGKKRVNDPAFIVTIRDALKEVDRLALMLDEFRSPARFETCELVRGDLVKLIQEIVPLQVLVCAPQGISVTFESDDAIPSIKLNTAKLKQVVLNLCKNAAEAMPEGGQLALKVYRSGPSVGLDITDNGIGIAHNPNTFELFKTTKPGGSGIGLSVVQQIVSAHNGTITCNSGAGHGTTFKIIFPAAD